MINEIVFYEKFKEFDWRFYVSIYIDLQKAGINTKQKAINHYWKFGQFEKRRTHKIITKHDLRPTDINSILQMVSQFYISDALHMFKGRFENTFPKLSSYYNANEACLFFGVYNDDDLLKLKHHKGISIIVPGGDDINVNNIHSLATINEVKHLNNTIFVSISKCIYSRLLNLDIRSIYVDFNLVDNRLFKPVPRNELGPNILIFNGQSLGRTHIYGESVYKKVVSCLSGYSFIYSNTLNVKYEEMPAIYKKCFIMLRLTQNDGNANSVQECEAMNIPVVHNQSEYGLKWKTVIDIIKYIEHYKC